jgi:ABC-2 type transport system ATP-binding protein
MTGGEAQVVTEAAPIDVRANEPAALELRGIHKTWDKTQHVLAGADLVLDRGSLAWIGGRNGVGKTTLMRIAAGLIAPDAGTVRLLGLDPERERRAFQRRVGFLSAGNAGLYARLKVRHNLEFASDIKLIPRRERRAAIDRAIERFELEPLVNKRSDRLSMGQRQRLRVAMTFLGEPEVILLDEPHTSLDAEALETVHRALAELVDSGGAALWCSPSSDKDKLAYDTGWVVTDGKVVPA